MELLNQNYGVTRRRFVSNSATDLTKTQPVSKLIILQARFQQKQLQEKEEKLLKLFEEQQERAMNRVGSRSLSGGSTSISSTSSVGRGKVRNMFQSRRGTSESRQGRDRSYPLEPIKSTRNHSDQIKSRKITGNWSLNRHNSDLQIRQYQQDSDDYQEAEEGEEEEEGFRFGGGLIRRTQSQARSQKPKSKLIYFGGSQTDLRFSDESDYIQTFQVIDDHYEITDKKNHHYDKDDYFINNFKNKREFYENRLRSDSDLMSKNSDPFDKLPKVGMNRKKDTRYKTFISQKGFNEKPHLGSKKPEETPPQMRQSNINQKIRKSTPMPTTVTPKTHLVTKPKEPPQPTMTPPIPASRTTITRNHTAADKISKKSLTNTKQVNNLPECQYCGRHFAEDRIGKHEEICKKSSKSKRKPFDSVKQRVKGTEAEQFLKGGKIKNQQKQVKPPEKDWRKTHEDFINSIRAAREYSTVQLRKSPATRTSTTSRY